MSELKPLPPFVRLYGIGYASDLEPGSLFSAPDGPVCRVVKLASTPCGRIGLTFAGPNDEIRTTVIHPDMPFEMFVDATPEWTN